MPKRPRIPPPFSFPPKPHRRVHGPGGHLNYRDYKPWLRDEFEFRCVYCLTRERWSNQGYNGFTIDHVKPKSIHGDLTADYDNLVYACFRCNTLKSTKVLPDPCKTSLAKHVKQRSGYFIPLTPLGKRLIEHLRLNEPERRANRLRHLSLFDGQRRQARELLDFTFGYPAELPDLLDSSRPPATRGLGAFEPAISLARRRALSRSTTRDRSQFGGHLRLGGRCCLARVGRHPLEIADSVLIRADGRLRIAMPEAFQVSRVAMAGLVA